MGVEFRVLGDVVATEVGNRYEQANAYDGMAAAHSATGNHGDARAQWEMAMRIHNSLGTVGADAVAASLRRLAATG